MKSAFLASSSFLSILLYKAKFFYKMLWNYFSLSTVLLDSILIFYSISSRWSRYYFATASKSWTIRLYFFNSSSFSIKRKLVLVVVGLNTVVSSSISDNWLANLCRLVILLFMAYKKLSLIKLFNYTHRIYGVILCICFIGLSGAIGLGLVDFVL